jgi:hypothetical protein
MAALTLGLLAGAAIAGQAIKGNQEKIAANRANDKAIKEQAMIKQEADAKADAEDAQRASVASRAIARERGSAGTMLGGVPNTQQGANIINNPLGNLGGGLSSTGLPLSPIASTGGTKTLLGS